MTSQLALAFAAMLTLAPGPLLAKAHAKAPKHQDKTPSGPFSEEQLWKGVEEAMQGPHAFAHTKGKCLQFAADVVRHAGAPHHDLQTAPKAAAVSANGLLVGPLSKAEKKCMLPDGATPGDLRSLALSGALKAGEAVHVKAHHATPWYKGHTADGHHWFVYMGTYGGEPLFADGVIRPDTQELARKKHWPAPAVAGWSDKHWSYVATAERIWHFIHGMSWPKANAEGGKCVCGGDEGKCKGGQRVQGIFDPWAR